MSALVTVIVVHSTHRFFRSIHCQHGDLPTNVLADYYGHKKPEAGPPLYGLDPLSTVYMTKVPEADAGCKVVIRLLPSELDGENFRLSLAPEFPPKVKFFSFAQGRKTTHSIAYAQFEGKDVAKRFLRNYNGHLFMNEDGEKFAAVATLAPNQRPGNYRIPQMAECKRKHGSSSARPGGGRGAPNKEENYACEEPGVDLLAKLKYMRENEELPNPPSGLKTRLLVDGEHDVDCDEKNTPLMKQIREERAGRKRERGKYRGGNLETLAEDGEAAYAGGATIDEKAQLNDDDVAWSGGEKDVVRMHCATCGRRKRCVSIDGKYICRRCAPESDSTPNSTKRKRGGRKHRERLERLEKKKSTSRRPERQERPAAARRGGPSPDDNTGGAGGGGANAKKSSSGTSSSGATIKNFGSSEAAATEQGSTPKYTVLKSSAKPGGSLSGASKGTKESSSSSCSAGRTASAATHDYAPKSRSGEASSSAGGAKKEKVGSEVDKSDRKLRDALSKEEEPAREAKAEGGKISKCKGCAAMKKVDNGYCDACWDSWSGHKKNKKRYR
eukprot:g17302.t1